MQSKMWASFVLLLFGSHLAILQAVTPVGISVTEYATGTTVTEMPKTNNVSPGPEHVHMTSTYETTSEGHDRVIIETSTQAATLQMKPTPTPTISRWLSSHQEQMHSNGNNKSDQEWSDIEYKNSMSPTPTFMEEPKSSEHPTGFEQISTTDSDQGETTVAEEDEDQETTPVTPVMATVATKMDAGEFSIWTATVDLNATAETHELPVTVPASEIDFQQEETTNRLKTPNMFETEVTTTTTTTTVMTITPVLKTTAEASWDNGTNVENVPRNWFVLMLEGNCTLALEMKSTFSSSLVREIARRLKVPREAAQVTNLTCGQLGSVDVNVTVISSRGKTEFQSLLDALENSKGPLITTGTGSFYVSEIRTKEGTVVREPDLAEADREDRHADVETIVYVALGSTCSFLILLALVLIFCKYCDTQIGRKGHFLRNPHEPPVTLEDYTLTRIPRPRMSYTDYCRGRAMENYYPLDEHEKFYGNMTHNQLQSFETSVVPLQDARVLDERVVARPTIFRVEDHQSSGSLWQSEECVGSTDNLQQCAGARSNCVGVDNPNFY